MQTKSQGDPPHLLLSRNICATLLQHVCLKSLIIFKLLLLSVEFWRWIGKLKKKKKLIVNFTRNTDQYYKLEGGKGGEKLCMNIKTGKTAEETEELAGRK